MNKKLSIVLLFFVIILCVGCNKSNNAVDKNATNNVNDTNESALPKQNNEAFQDHSNDPIDISSIGIDSVYYKDEENGEILNEVNVDQIIFPEEYVITNPKLNEAIIKYNQERDEEGKRFLSEQHDEIRIMRKDRNDDTLVLSYNDTVVINRIDNKIFSFSEENDCYTGGAHGSYVMIGRNFDVNDGHIITSNELFTDKNLLKKYLIDNIKSAYAEEELFPEWQDTLEQHFKDDLEFNILIGEDFVDVMFDPYYLAPWSTGMVNVTISTEENMNLLNEKFFN